MRHILALLAMLCIPSTMLRAEELPEVDLLLVLAADVSTSIDDSKFALQRKGYATAIAHKQVVNAATSGRMGRIGLVYFEWADPLDQHVVVDWSLIDGQSSADTFANSLTESPRPFKGGTAIGAALHKCMRLLDHAPFRSNRKICDVSGDGTSNRGPGVNGARTMLVEQDIIINGLVILTSAPTANLLHTHPEGGLQKYYQDNVIGGPGSFVLVAKSFETFAEAIRKKLILEIASLR